MFEYLQPTNPIILYTLKALVTSLVGMVLVDLIRKE